MKILVTGVTGFVGAHLERVLLRSHYEVSGVVRSKKHSLNPKIQILLVDDITTCNFKELTRGYDAVVHLASIVHQPNQTDIDAYMRTNHDVTVAIAKACAVNKVSKFIT